MNILYLYSEVMGYTLSVAKEVVRISGAEIHIVYWDHKKNTPFRNTALSGITYYKRSEYTSETLIDLYERLKPEIIYVSGRMDKEYLKVVRYARKRQTPVVSGFDNQWTGSIKNYIASLFSYFMYRRYFNYLWVAGERQNTYAKRLGYSSDKILNHVYSADTSLFSESYNKSGQIFTKRFVFVGRLENVKGISFLIEAFNRFCKNDKEWQLWIVGNGSLRNIIPVNERIVFHDFLQPDDLAKICKGRGVFVLPSIHEPWGVVLHEFAAAGFPIICTDCCGASTLFVNHSVNGYIVKTADSQNLLEAMIKISESDISTLLKMGDMSHELSLLLNPEKSARSFLSVLNKKS